MTAPLAVRAARRRELVAFLLLTAVLMPVVTVGAVGGYGLAVWCWQMVAGPPGPAAAHATTPAASHKG